MPEILYRDDVNRFSVYRLRDIPDGAPCSGTGSLRFWQRHGVDLVKENGRHYLARLNKSDHRCMEDLVAVLDEHAGPLITKPTRTVQRIVTRPIEIPAVDFHREMTKYLGAQHGEGRLVLNRHDSAAWSAHLRYLVSQSAQRDREREATMSGWDPYGDD